MILKLFFISFQFVFAQNWMHPTFQLRDSRGNVTTTKPSFEHTCQVCHDTDFINSHSSHEKDSLHVNCMQCHFKNGFPELNKNMLDSHLFLKKEWVQNLQKPTANACLKCHGEVTQPGAPLVIQETPESFKFWSTHLRQGQGSFFSDQKLESSGMNLENKNGSARSWDVHGQRQMNCTSCHSTENSPRNNQLLTSKVNHLRFDIRQELDLSQYLRQPNHQFKTTTCQGCHQAERVHDNFPYLKRHLATVACQSCHIPTVAGPILKSINRSMVSEKGIPIVTYWNNEYDPLGKSKENAQLNTSYTKNFVPFLLQAKGVISPYNIVNEKKWIFLDDKDHQNHEVSESTIQQLIWKNPKIRNSFFKITDQDKNGDLSTEELNLNTPQKIEFVQDLLVKNGYPYPQLVEKNYFIKIGHGILNGRMATQNCQSCHGQNSRLNQQIQSISEPTGDWLKSVVSMAVEEKIQLPQVKTYVLGTSKNRWVDQIGISTLILLLMLLATHGFFRWKLRPVHLEKSIHFIQEKVKIYGRFERFWHWTLALSTSFLLLTGLEIHYTGQIHIFGLKAASFLHNISAIIFFINSFISLVYYISSKRIKMFLPGRYQLWFQIVDQLKYYSYGIFTGKHKHHSKKHMDSKLNPLQQVTYLLLLNILLPLQIVTGVLMWSVDKFEYVSQRLGGYNLIAPIHTAGSWSFLIFLILHIYLTTTGTTPLSNIKSMLTGEEDVFSDSKGKNHHE